APESASPLARARGEWKHVYRPGPAAAVVSPGGTSGLAGEEESPEGKRRRQAGRGDGGGPERDARKSGASQADRQEVETAHPSSGLPVTTLCRPLSSS
ncbi:unnamed protein product, partial [Ascophyllum nodosum]